MTDIINVIPDAYNSNQPTLKDKDLLKITEAPYLRRHLPHPKIFALSHVITVCQELINKQGIYSSIALKAAGFNYMGDGDRARCEDCGLEVSGWTSDMKPFEIHSQRSPHCSYVRGMTPCEKLFTPLVKNFLTTSLETSYDEMPTKRQKIEESVQIQEPNTLQEVDLVQQMRKRTFSHWPHRSSPSSSQMIEAGFFNCNVGDRVICLYCNLICQQWVPNSDDSWEAHKTLSPTCPYVIATLKRQQTASIRIVNEQSTRENTANTNTATEPVRFNEIVYTAACHTAYIEIPRRHASFTNWPDENSPSVDDLVKAGFFYTGTKTIVTCFYCNGSLQNWGANDNPTIEHARWFPHCAYAKQLCGTDLYRKIQESKKAQQDRIRGTDSSRQGGGGGGGNGSTGRGQLNIPDESTLSRFVAARLDLPISQNMLDRNFKLSIIKRCWEDQLRLKHDDFIDYCDLFMACIILQKQIECIDGKKENIIVPSLALKKIRDKEQEDARARELAASTTSSTTSSNITDVEMSSTTDSTPGEGNLEESSVKTGENKIVKTVKAGAAAGGKSSGDDSSSNLCVLCLEEEKRLACIPCGHLATCVPCGHSLRSCPICRTGIDAFVRIYM